MCCSSALTGMGPRLQPGSHALQVVLLCQLHEAHALQVWQGDARGVHKRRAQHLRCHAQSSGGPQAQPTFVLQQQLDVHAQQRMRVPCA